MNDTKLRFEYFACLTASSANIEQYEQATTDYHLHKSLCETDKGYGLYELPTEKNSPCSNKKNR